MKHFRSIRVKATVVSLLAAGALTAGGMAMPAEAHTTLICGSSLSIASLSFSQGNAVACASVEQKAIVKNNDQFGLVNVQVAPITQVAAVPITQVVVNVPPFVF